MPDPDYSLANYSSIMEEEYDWPAEEESANYTYGRTDYALLETDNQFAIYTDATNCLIGSSSLLYPDWQVWYGNMQREARPDPIGGNTASFYSRGNITDVGAVLQPCGVFDRYQVFSCFIHRDAAHSSDRVVFNIHNTTSNKAHIATFLWASTDVQNYSITITGVAKATAGLEYYGDGWLRPYLLVDSTEDGTSCYGNAMSIFIYPNYSGAVSPLNPDGVVLWGASLEKSKYPIRRPGAFRPTTSSPAGTGYTKIAFPYNPSNIVEVENNLYTSLPSVDGKVVRSSRIKDIGIKSMKWEIVDYTKYATFYDNLRTVLYKNIGKDVILQYPSYVRLVSGTLKTRFVYIRVLDVQYIYTEHNNCASIELKYVITGSVY